MVKRRKTELAVFNMSRNVVDYPSDKPFSSKLLSRVVKYHHRNKAKGQTGLFKWVRCAKNHRQRTLWFQNSECWDTIGWVKCSRACDANKPLKSASEAVATDSDRNSAMRSQVYNETRLKFILENGAYKPDDSNWHIPECPECGCKDVPLNVDHNVDMYCELRDRWLSDSGLRLCDIKVKKLNMSWVMSDSDQSAQWECYHDANVVYAIMCVICHKNKTKSDLKRLWRASQPGSAQ